MKWGTDILNLNKCQILVNNRALLCILILGITVYCIFLVRVENELKRSDQALQHVISWRQKMITASGSGDEVQIVCSDSDQIRKSSDNVQKKIIQCDELIHGRSVYPVPKLDYLMGNSILWKGRIDAVDGTKCQEWTVTPTIAGRYVQPGLPDVEEVCIGVKDHLPRRVKYREAEYLFYDWKLRTKN